MEAFLYGIDVFCPRYWVGVIPIHKPYNPVCLRSPTSSKPILPQYIQHVSRGTSKHLMRIEPVKEDRLHESILCL